MSKRPKNIPFEFILDFLCPLDVEIKPMFGCFSLYTDGKLVLFLRDRLNDLHENGIWIAATDKGFESLAEELGLKSPDESSNKKWLLISPDDSDFEIKTRTVCELIIAGDNRIGRTKSGA